MREELLSEGKKGKPWKFGKKKGIRGSVSAALKHHPDKFSKDACKKGGDSGKMCPYAIFTAKKKKEDFEPHYKDQPTTSKKAPKKKAKFKNEDKPKKKKKHCPCGSSFAEYVENRQKMYQEAEYVFDDNQSVEVDGRQGTITSKVPAGGSVGGEAYYIIFDDSGKEEGPFFRSQITPIRERIPRRFRR